MRPVETIPTTASRLHHQSKSTMAIMAQIKTGKNRTVKYGKEYLGDDTIMDDIRATQRM